MVTKRETPARKSVGRKPKAAAPPASGNGTAGSSPESINPELRRQWVADEAYFRAERRGFLAGHELEDWVEAEAAVAARL
jgi:hypothetical protein